jgi:FKBP-type peptidyl-prolyl cis-trans isomerase
MKKNIIIVLVIVLIVIVAGAIYFSLPKTNKNMTDTTNQTPQEQQNSSDQNATNFDIQGMKVEVLKEGTGEGAKVGDNINVNYTGMLTDGIKFDSSVDPSFGHVAPFPYTLGQNRVIKGWELGLLGMRVGEERRLTIPADLAYGAQSPSPLIPANSTLVFEVTMVGIN